MDLAAADLERPAIEREVVRADDEGVSVWLAGWEKRHSATEHQSQEDRGLPRRSVPSHREALLAYQFGEERHRVL